MKILLALAVTMVMQNAGASDRWIEKRDPEELYAYVDVYECPIDVDELRAAAHEVMIRSRIRPPTVRTVCPITWSCRWGRR